MYNLILIMNPTLEYDPNKEISNKILSEVAGLWSWKKCLLLIGVRQEVKLRMSCGPVSNLTLTNSPTLKYDSNDETSNKTLGKYTRLQSYQQ